MTPEDQKWKDAKLAFWARTRKRQKPGWTNKDEEAYRAMKASFWKLTREKKKRNAMKLKPSLADRRRADHKKWQVSFAKDVGAFLKRDFAAPAVEQHAMPWRDESLTPETFRRCLGVHQQYVKAMAIALKAYNNETKLNK